MPAPTMHILQDPTQSAFTVATLAASPNTDVSNTVPGSGTITFSDSEGDTVNVSAPASVGFYSAYGSATTWNSNWWDFGGISTATYTGGNQYVETRDFCFALATNAESGANCGNMACVPDLDGAHVWNLSSAWEDGSSLALQQYNVSTLAATKTWLWPYLSNMGVGANGLFLTRYASITKEVMTPVFFQDSSGNVFTMLGSGNSQFGVLNQGLYGSEAVRLFKNNPASSFAEVASLGYSGITPLDSWQANTTYPTGHKIVTATTGIGGVVYVIEATVGGTTAGTIPTFPAVAGTVVDGGVTWRNNGWTQEIVIGPADWCSFQWTGTNYAAFINYQGLVEVVDLDAMQAVAFFDMYSTLGSTQPIGASICAHPTNGTVYWFTVDTGGNVSGWHWQLGVSGTTTGPAPYNNSAGSVPYLPYMNNVVHGSNIGGLSASARAVACCYDPNNSNLVLMFDTSTTATGAPDATWMYADLGVMSPSNLGAGTLTTHVAKSNPNYGAMFNPQGVGGLLMSAFRSGCGLSKYNGSLTGDTALPIQVDIASVVGLPASQRGGQAALLNPSTLAITATGGPYNLTNLIAATLSSDSNYNYRGTWASGTTYALGDIAQGSDGMYYFAADPCNASSGVGTPNLGFDPTVNNFRNKTIWQPLPGVLETTESGWTGTWVRNPAMRPFVHLTSMQSAGVILANYGSATNMGSPTYLANLVAGPQPSATNLVATTNPVQALTSTNLTATVTPSSPTPTGTVTFYDGATPIQSNVPLVGGAATISASFHYAGGAHNLSAVYSGDSNYDPSTGLLTENVTQIPTNLSLSASPNPGLNTASVSVLAAVTSTPVPGTGTVTFKDSVSTIGIVPLNVVTSQATLIYTFGSVGVHHLSATFSTSGGDWADSTGYYLENIEAPVISTLPGLALIAAYLTTDDSALPPSASIAVIPARTAANSPFTLVWSTFNVAKVQITDSQGFVNTPVFTNPSDSGGSYSVPAGIPTGPDVFTLHTFDASGSPLSPTPTTSIQIT